MFVDALDAQMYDRHHQTGHCILSIHKEKKRKMEARHLHLPHGPALRVCDSRLLELVVNVWAFHSARRMVYVNPETAAMQEQHQLSGRSPVVLRRYSEEYDEELAW